MGLKASSIDECPNIEELWNISTSHVSDNVTSGEILLSHSDIGPYVHVICQDGYHVVGSAMITCLKGGLWDDVRKPHCSSSSLYGIAESDLILLGVLTGCGAITILALTIVLSRLLCFRVRGPHSARSLDSINHGVDTITTPYRKHYSTVSPPTSPTLNGKPLTPANRLNRHAHHASDSAYSHAYHHDNQSDTMYMQQKHDQHHGQSQRTYTVPYTHALSTIPTSIQPCYASSHVPRDLPERMTSLEEGGVFVNEAFTDDIATDYATRWENERNIYGLEARQNSHPVYSIPSPPPCRASDHSHPSPPPGYPSPPPGLASDYSVDNRTTF